MPFTHFNDNNNGLTYLLVRGMMDSVTSYFVRCDVLRCTYGADSALPGGHEKDPGR